MTETWLHAHVRDQEIFDDATNFHMYRCDRTVRRGGGVLLAVSKDTPSSCIHINTELELVWAIVTIGHHKIILGVCYRSPSSPSTFVDELHDAINIVCTRFPSHPLFLLGDFNFPSIMWNAYAPYSLPSSPQPNEFINLCSTFSLTQVVALPTRATTNSASILDLILTNRPDFVTAITYAPGISDHSLLSFSFNAPCPNRDKKKKKIRDYKKANFDKINSELATFLDIFLSSFDTRSVQCNWDMFADEVEQLTNKYIPCRTITTNARAPWYNAYIKRLSNRKKRFYRAARCLPTNHPRWAAYKSASSIYISALKSAKDNFLTQVLPSMLQTNAKKFWRVINPLSDNHISLIDSSGNEISEALCASVLNDSFIQNFSVDSHNDLPSATLHNYSPMSSVIIETLGVVRLIESLKNDSSPGYDGINTKFLKNTSAYSSIIVTKIFQQSLDTSTIPSQWKIGKVVPLHKSGNKHSSNNYRPISLTSICCKMLEHIIFTNIVNFLESNSFFTSAQHGFRKTYSCETQLISFTHHLHQILDKSSHADCIFLDFSKAFDKVCHRLLLYKLHQLNLDGNLLMWIECFLTNRSQFVTANCHNSPFREVHSGVPQGSVLGPLLFLIYINDLSSVVSSKIHLFADDCVIFREITTDNDINILQSDLNAISNWCDKWLMDLNIKKCKIMRVSRSCTTSPIYYLNNIPLDSVNSYKYLGVHITTNLNWTTHIEYIIINANRMLGYLRRNFFNAPHGLKLLLYKTLIRSKLEYATTVWDPTYNNLVTSLELVQNNSVRFILSNYNRTASISTMKTSLALPSLASRRKVSRLTLFHKIYHHPILHAQLLLRPQHISHRIDHHHKVGIPSCNTKTFNSFLLCTLKEWTKLPGHIVAISDENLFRVSID